MASGSLEDLGSAITHSSSDVFSPEEIDQESSGDLPLIAVEANTLPAETDHQSSGDLSLIAAPEANTTFLISAEIPQTVRYVELTENPDLVEFLVSQEIYKTAEVTDEGTFLGAIARDSHWQLSDSLSGGVDGINGEDIHLGLSATSSVASDVTAPSLHMHHPAKSAQNMKISCGQSILLR